MQQTDPLHYTWEIGTLGEQSNHFHVNLAFSDD